MSVRCKPDALCFSDGYGLQGRGPRRSHIGVAIEGAGDSKRSFAGDGDSRGHVVREGSLPKDGKAEEVDLKLSESSRSVPSHVSTSRAIVRLDIWFGKE